MNINLLPPYGVLITNLTSIYLTRLQEPGGVIN